ncbi:MAG: DUF6446 family protein [Pseudomonadota bacterium]
MNAGKVAVVAIVTVAAVFGAAIYYLQIYAYYTPVTFVPGNEIRLTPIAGDQPEAIVANDVTGIDADSSPLRFRACFTTPLSQGLLTETYKVYEKAEPLLAPGWFDCFDAARIDKALEQGEALAFLSEANIHPGVNRVVAVFPDGSGYAWNQLNDDLKE